MNRPGIVILVLLLSNQLLPAQMLNPSIDRDDEPFCYFSQPTDVIGVMDGKEGTLITPEGYLYTGSAELMFFTGDPPVPVNQRVKTLERHAPVLHYTFVRDGIRYEISAFAATLDGNPESPLMNFARARIHNTLSEGRTAFFGAGCRYQNDVNTDWGFGDNRFARPETSKVLGGRTQRGVRFDREWTYELRNDFFVRGGKAVYLFPTSPEPEKRITLKTGDNSPFLAGPQQMDILPSTPAGIVVYAIGLQPGESRVLDFKMPYEPLDPSGADFAALQAARFDDYYGRTVSFWQKIFDAGIQIELPEQKVVDTFDANLLFPLIARNKEGGHFIQKVNEFQYDAFWLRDASAIVRMYDISGYHRIARECLEFFPRWQQPDGNFLSQGGQYDGWGQALYAYGQHYRFTRDLEFAEGVFPSILKAVDWLRAARRSDPYHLIPATTPGDNEEISGHVTGHNFIALGGLLNAIAIADGLDAEEAKALRAEYDDFLAALKARLGVMTAAGYIPPGLDSLGGNDWGNMESVSPEQILSPHDRMVTATLAETRKKYAEGIMTYSRGRWLHHYLTISNTETEVIRGDDRLALEELYALLVHTGSTHTGFEFSIIPWGTRDFGMNLAPHGWFSAKFRSLLRNMLVREAGKTLHLFSCLSPAWIRDGATVAVRRAPTFFGTIDAELKFAGEKASLKISSTFTDAPERIVVHVPWFLDLQDAIVDGRKVTIEGNSIILPAGARSAEISWRRKAGAPEMSYAKAVSDYRKEYRTRYEKFLQTGN